MLADLPTNPDLFQFEVQVFPSFIELQCESNPLPNNPCANVTFPHTDTHPFSFSWSAESECHMRSETEW